MYALTQRAPLCCRVIAAAERSLSSTQAKGSAAAAAAVGQRGVGIAAAAHIVRKAGKRFKKSQKFDVMDFIEIDMGGPYASFVPCTVHKNSF